jgi:hypothetical protein
LTAENSVHAANNLDFVQNQSLLQAEITALKVKVEAIQLEKDNFEEDVEALANDKEALELKLREMTKANEELETKRSNAMVSVCFKESLICLFLGFGCDARQPD